MRLAATVSLMLGMVLAGRIATSAQTVVPAAAATQPQSQSPAGNSAVAADNAKAQAAPGSTVTGGRIHGVATSGKTPLPGVTVTAQNTLTGKRYSTTTDISGAWSLNIPQNGRYVIRTQFAAFAVGSQEARLNADSHDQMVNFDLMLASRAAAQQQAQAAAGTDSSGMQAMRQLAGNGAQSLSLVSSLSADTETQAGTPSAGGAALPSIAANSDFGGDSVAISGQSGQVSPMAGVDMDRLRDAMETMRAQGGQFGGGNFGGGGAGGGGGFGGFGGGFGGAAAVSEAGDSAVAGAATSVASIPASRMARSSGRAAIRRSMRSRFLCRVSSRSSRLPAAIASALLS
jgi:hypothetical protein